MAICDKIHSDLRILFSIFLTYSVLIISCFYHTIIRTCLLVCLQVELTGNSIFEYIHSDDQPEMTNVLNPQHLTPSPSTHPSLGHGMYIAVTQWTLLYRLLIKAGLLKLCYGWTKLYFAFLIGDKFMLIHVIFVNVCFSFRIWNGKIVFPPHEVYPGQEERRINNRRLQGKTNAQLPYLLFILRTLTKLTPKWTRVTLQH